MSPGNTVKPRPAGLRPRAVATTVFKCAPKRLNRSLPETSASQISVSHFFLILFHQGERYLIFFIFAQLSHIPRAMGPECPAESRAVHQPGNSQLYQKRS